MTKPLRITLDIGEWFLLTTMISSTPNKFQTKAQNNTDTYSIDKLMEGCAALLFEGGPLQRKYCADLVSKFKEQTANGYTSIEGLSPRPDLLKLPNYGGPDDPFAHEMSKWFRKILNDIHSRQIGYLDGAIRRHRENHIGLWRAGGGYEAQKSHLHADLNPVVRSRMERAIELRDQAWGQLNEPFNPDLTLLVAELEKAGWTPTKDVVLTKRVPRR